ncbi:ABC transporter permease [Capnocytophaga sp. ARDL2]|uniref:ABC transporter permease n=1 Tax=Capnocytophaga sp. ARDL2 TaxID=3238809 RepID=UPI0035564C55
MIKLVYYIAKRYAFSKSKTKGINIITTISSLGIVMSTMALFVVLSVFSGLESHIRTFTDALDPELTIFPKKGKTIQLSPEKLQQINQINGVQHTAQVVEERVVFTYGGKQQVATIKAVSAGYDEVFGVRNFTDYDQWIDPNTHEVVLDKNLVYQLGIGQNPEENILEVLAMKPGKGLLGSVEDAYVSFPLYPIDVYMAEAAGDGKSFVFADLEVGQKLLSLNQNQYSKLELKIDENQNLKPIIQQIETHFPNQFEIKTREQLNDSLYKMLKTEALAVYLVFTLVIVITLFCLCGALIMIILEKKEAIKTLSYLGFTIQNIRKIFFLQGMIITALGTLVGLILGVIIAFCQKQFQWIMVNPTFAYPIEWRFENVATVLATLLILGLIACLITSSRIRREMIER